MSKKNVLVENESNRQDLGFGTKLTDRRKRLLKQDGQFNIKRKGQSFEAWLNIYNRFIMMRWGTFFLIVLMVYLLLNFLFAITYYIIGVEHLVGVNMTSVHSQFWDAFFFSAQSLTTVGYGRISPDGFAASWVSSLESLVGLMMFAIVTGLLYGRFSKPNPRILFSTNALIAPYLNINAFMFRMVNERSNQLINMEVSLVFSKIEERNGVLNRRYYGLKLERSKVNFFPTDWTIVHPLTEDSPMYNETPESLATSDAEFMIAIQGVDDTFADAVHVRHSYKTEEIVWGAKFTPMIEEDGDETYILDLKKVGNYRSANLNY
ncbi:ion channel [Emticicia sp. BO119]|uniref:ion channel n=1 Tax=Emticicia sp. BO119 TaxID=2757768 RepID=UPI0015F060B3|nr:ion channel [Emticicia sp. BO119]MBA4853134.1 potassium transporter [Emticicia sp. BO119]